LDPKVTKRSRQKKASARSVGSLRFLRAAHIAKAKPSFTPYSRPAFLSTQHSFRTGSFIENIVSNETRQQTGFRRNQSKHGGLCGGKGSKLCRSEGLAGTLVAQSIAARGFD
ncbi:MAG: hypothetical protein JST50_21890, partial [Bacteroidetes bacterium]|nr:hypothetical protein [Bacteroidota bacterium]